MRSLNISISDHVMNLICKPHNVHKSVDMWYGLQAHESWHVDTECWCQTGNPIAVPLSRRICDMFTSSAHSSREVFPFCNYFTNLHSWYSLVNTALALCGHTRATVDMALMNSTAIDTTLLSGHDWPIVWLGGTFIVGGTHIYVTPAYRLLDS